MSKVSIEFIHGEYSKYYEGYFLVGSYELYLPFYQTNLCITYTSTKPMNIIEEYIGRAIEEGCKTLKEIEQTLGLERYMSAYALGDLKQKGYVTGGRGEVPLSLTDKGHQQLEVHMEEVSKVTDMKWAHWGLQDCEAVGPWEMLYGGAKRKEELLKEEEAYYLMPSQMKEVTEEELQNISFKVVEAYNDKLENQEQPMLGIQSIERMEGHKILFVPYTLMVFKNLEGEHKYLVYHEECEDGIDLDLTQFIQSLHETNQLEQALRCTDEEQKDEFIQAVEEAGSLEIVYENLVENYEKSYEENHEENYEKNCEETIAQMTQYIMNTEIRQLFLRFLKEAQESLYIISPWMNYYIINDAFYQDLENLLKRGVRVKIIYGIGKVHGETDPRNLRSKQIAEELQNFAAPYGELFSITHGHTHEKLCICDGTHLINGSFNFLSYGGEEKQRGFRNEGSIYTTNKEFIESVTKMRFEAS